MIKYVVSWNERWIRDSVTFTDLEEAIKWAKMKKNMNYKEVKLEKMEITEIDF